MISIHAPREGSDLRQARASRPRTISIHAPREGSDFAAPGGRVGGLDFNPRSPRGERPHTVRLPLATDEHFNPRSPRGERPLLDAQDEMTRAFQSTLPARGATIQRGHLWRPMSISIHAPREGSDRRERAGLRRGPDISIHAPREGSDSTTKSAAVAARNFNPRSPRGERP